MPQTIRLEVGVGWQLICREVREVEKTQMSYQYPDSLVKKNLRSFFLPYDWSSRNQSKITTAIADLKRLMEERNLSLKEATKFMIKSVSKDKAPTITIWKNIVEAFIE